MCGILVSKEEFLYVREELVKRYAKEECNWNVGSTLRVKFSPFSGEPLSFEILGFLC